MVIDSSRRGQRRSGAYVTAARTGQMPAAPRKVGKPAPRQPASAYHADDQELARLLKPDQPAAQSDLHAAFAADSFGKMQALPPIRSDDASYEPVASTNFSRRKPNRKQPARWPIYVASAAVTLILFGGGAALWLAKNGGNEVAEVKATPSAPTPAANGPGTTEVAPHNTSAKPAEQAHDGGSTNLPRSGADKSGDVGHANAPAASDPPIRPEVRAKPVPPPTPPASSNVKPQHADAGKLIQHPEQKVDEPRAPLADQKVNEADASHTHGAETKEASAKIDGLASSASVVFRSGIAGRMEPIELGNLDFALARGCKLSLLGRMRRSAKTQVLGFLNSASIPINVGSNGRAISTAQMGLMASSLLPATNWDSCGSSPREAAHTPDTVKRLNGLSNCALRIAFASRAKIIALREPIVNSPTHPIKPLPLKMIDLRSSFTSKSGEISITHPPTGKLMVEALPPRDPPPGISFQHPKSEGKDELIVYDAAQAPADHDVWLLLRATITADPSAEDRFMVALNAEAPPGKWAAYLPGVDPKQKPSKTKEKGHGSGGDKDGAPQKSRQSPTPKSNHLNAELLSEYVVPALNDNKSVLKKNLDKLRKDKADSRKIENAEGDLASAEHECKNAQSLGTVMETVLGQNSNVQIGYRVYLEIEGNYQLELLRVDVELPKAVGKTAIDDK